VRWHALALAVLAECGGGDGEADDGPTVVRAAPATVDETGYDLVARSNRTTNTTLTLSIQGDVELNPTFAVRATTRADDLRAPDDRGDGRRRGGERAGREAV
jgi:hypothetical protein